MAFKKKAQEEMKIEEPRISTVPKSIPKEEWDGDDFTKILNWPTDDFAKALMERIIKETKIVQNERHEFDFTDINRILSRYPQYFAWVIVEAERISEIADRAKDDYEDWYRIKYMEAQGRLTGSKFTIETIKAEIVNRQEKELRERRDEVRSLEAKANMAKGLVKVWGNAINSLQSLNRNLTMEYEMMKKRMTD